MVSKRGDSEVGWKLEWPPKRANRWIEVGVVNSSVSSELASPSVYFEGDA